MVQLTAMSCAGTKLKMTGPFTTYKERSPQGMKMQMCFYIPSENQASPPQPTMEGVTIHKKNKMKVAARLVEEGQRSTYVTVLFSFRHISG